LQNYLSGEIFSAGPVKYEHSIYINPTPYWNALDMVNYNIIEYLCLGKLKLGKLEIKFSFHQILVFNLIPVLTTYTWKPHTTSFFGYIKVLLIYTYTCIASNSTQVPIYY
jgi:hypothetical protein